MASSADARPQPRAYQPGWKFPPSFAEEFEAAFQQENQRRHERGEIPISRQQLVERWLREAMRRRGRAA